MKTFYVGLAAIIEKNNHFLILKRSSNKDFAPNTWEPVTGRLERDENPENGVLREIEEEVGIEAQVVMPIATSCFYRGGQEVPMVFIYYWVKYLEGEVKLSWEHSEYKWVTLEEALKESTLEYFHKELQKIVKLKELLPKEFIL
ncbi:MAG: NUDIX domain-containing protein [Promethearchaeota archaeon]